MSARPYSVDTEALAAHRAQRERRRRQVERIIAERGLRVEPFGEHGARRIFGPGVDVLIGDFRSLGPLDLEPVIEGWRFRRVH